MSRSPEDVRRRLAALLFADVVGYSTLSSTDEDQALLLVHRFEAAARKATESHDGRIVKFLGDGVLAEFASAADAAGAARQLAEEFQTDPSARLRVGIHIGEIATLDGEDVHGDGVNVAARIQSLAEPGQILVSEDAHRQLRQRSAFRFRSLGKHSLKGLAAPVGVYALTQEADLESKSIPAPPSGLVNRIRSLSFLHAVIGLALLVGGLAILTLRLDRGRTDASAGAVSSDSQSALTERSIAVLPFANLSPNPEEQYFVDGVTEEVTLALTRVPDLRVISNTSASRYAGSDKSIRQIAQELGVATVLEGSVRREGNRIRISAQLIAANSDEHLWAETFDRELADVFQIQSEIAQRIAEQLQASFTETERQRILAGATRDPMAHDLYLRAAAQIEQIDAGRNEVEPSIELLQEAVRRDPSFAHAWEFLFALHLWSVLWRGAAAEDSARAAMDRAMVLELEPARKRTLQAIRAWHLDDQPKQAIAFAREAAELAPNNPEILFRLGELYLWHGDLPEAVHWGERLVAVDPVNPAIYPSLIDSYLALELDDRAEALARRLIRIAPSLPNGWLELSRVRLRQGRYDEALVAADSAMTRSPREPHAAKGLALLWSGDARGSIPELTAYVERSTDDQSAFVKPALSYAYRSTGDPQRAAAVLEGVAEDLDVAIRRVKWNPPLLQYTLVLVTVASGEEVLALEQLQNYVDIGGRDTRLVASDPVLEPIRNAARYREILEDLRARTVAMRARVVSQVN